MSASPNTPQVPTRDRFIRAAALALAAAIRNQDEDGTAEVGDLRELAELLIEVVYDDQVMPC